MSHQPVAQALTAVAQRDQHHAHGRQARAVPGQDHGPGQAAVRIVDAIALGGVEQKRPFALLGGPFPVGRQRQARLQVVRAEAMYRPEAGRHS